MQLGRSDRDAPARETWFLFALAAILGAGSTVALLIFGVVGVLPVGLVIWIVAARPRLRRSAWGAISGVGLILLFVAYVQRRGPGTVCTTSATVSSCDQFADPRPWLVAGLGLVVAGVVLETWRVRRAHRPADAG